MFEDNIKIAGIAFTLAFLAQTYLRKKSSKNAVYVKELWIYPIKSCKGIQLTQADISRRGFLYDREFMLIDGNRKFVSQRTFPRMALLETALENEYLIVTSPNLPNDVLRIPLSQRAEGENVEVTVWGDICPSVDLGDDVSAWFCRALETAGLRLVRFAQDGRRATDPQYAPEGEVSMLV